MPNPAASSLGEFLDEVWGTEAPVEGQQAYAYMPVKETTGKLTKNFVRWPEKRDAAINFILKVAANPEAEVFYSPALYKSMKPVSSNVLGSHVLWTDFDGNYPTDWPTAIAPIPSIEVQSSVPSKRHVYWKLDGFETDPKRLEKLNRSLAYALGADLSGWDAAQFLRPPHSTHRKGTPLPVKVVANRLERVYNQSVFSDIPTPAEAIRDELALGELPSIEEVLALAKWDKEMLALFEVSKEEMSGPTHDRSGALQRLAYFGAEQLWTDEQIMAVLLDADDRWEKYSGRSTRNKILAELINRARAKHGYEATTFEGLLKSIATTSSEGQAVEDDESIFDITSLATMPGIDDWTVQDMLIPTGLGLITGRPGVGKTQLAFQMAADLATGRSEFIDWETPTGPVKVLFLSLEMGAHQLGHMAKPLRERYPEETLDQNLFVHAKGDPLPLDQEAGQAYFLQLLDRYKPQVVFIDSLSLAVAGNLSNDDDMKKMFDFLKVARNALEFALVIVHHHRKKANDAQSKKTPNTQSDIYGSYIVTASIDFALDLEEIGSDADNGEITLSMLKNRYAPVPAPFKVARSEKLHFSRNEISFRSSLLEEEDES